MLVDQKDSKLISVIIPCFNNERYIVETLSSISDQLYENWECIIVDDGSTDGTYQIVSDFITSDDRFHYFKRPDNYLKGANSCRNFGAKKSKGKYLIFLDSDDLLVQDTLKNRIESINSDNIDVAIFRTFKFKNVIGDTLETSVQSDNELNGVIKSFYNYNISWNIHSVLWKKSFFIKVGEFDDKLSRFQDYDLHLRMLATVKSGQLVLFPYENVDSYYRFSHYHSTMTVTKKTLILNDAKYLIKKFKEKYNMSFGAGFINYLFYQYNCVFTKEDYRFFSNHLVDLPQKDILLIKAKVSGFFRFNTLINKIVSKLLFRVL